MAIELKDLAELLEVEIVDADTADTVKEKLHSTWIPRKMADSDQELVNKVLGKRLGALTTAVRREFKEAGLELSDEEIKDKKLEEVVAIAAGKAKNTFSELKEKASAGNDAKLKAADKALEEFQKKYTDLEGLQLATKQKLEDTEKSMSSQIKQSKLNYKVNEIEAKIPYSEGATDLVKRGFRAMLDEKYVRDLDENDNVIVLDKSKNERVRNEKGTDFATWEDVVTREAKAANILKVSDVNKNGSGFQRYQGQGSGQRQTSEGGEPKGRRIHPNAARAAGL